MNGFFAAVEELDHPAYRGKPVGVVPIMTDGTSFIAANYQAKKLGVRMGIPVWQARRQFPELIIVKARPARYIEVQKQILAAADKHAPMSKAYSIDEWSVRLSPAEQAVDVAVDLARRIKRQIAADVGPEVTCSAGVAPTRLLAKIACDLQKPDGLTVLTTDDLPTRLEGLEIDDLPGISGSMRARLERHGIHSVTDLWNMTRQRARMIWGSVMGPQWWCGFHGIDVPEVVTHRSSMGHSNVLEPKFRNEYAAHGILVRLICKLGMRLRFHGYFANHLTVWVRHECGRVWGDEIALPCVQDTPTILQQFERLWQRRQAMLRRVSAAGGVSRPKKIAADVMGLTAAANVSAPLFEALDRPLRVSHVLDRVNAKAGKHALYFGSMHDFRHTMDDKIAFGRVPDESVTV